MPRQDRRRFLALAGAAAASAGAARASAKPGDGLAGLSLSAASQLVRSRKVSPVELTEACLRRIEAYDPTINAFITVTADLARARARQAEGEIARGDWRGPLHGLPLALKDNIDTAGVRTSAGSEVFAGRIPGEDAPVVKRLKAAGAVLLGKLNMGEFAMSESVVSFWGPVHNPWALDRETGGSSSGAGAALAADFCFGALGTDTAGSIRMPAAHCSVVGLKPTYGLVSIRGVVPLIESMDHVGPMAKTVEDAAILLQAVAGYDPDGFGSVDAVVGDYAAAVREPVSRLRVGVARMPFLDGADPEIVRAFEADLTAIRALVAELREVEAPAAEVDVLALYAGEAVAYHRPLQKLHGFEYQPSNRGKFSGPKGAEGWDAAADYVLAKRALVQARRAIPAYFRDVDLIVLPTLRYTARLNAPLLEEVNKGIAVGSSNTRPFDILGLPAISVPGGFTAGGLPIGLQIVGAPFAEGKVVALAAAFERATPWRLRKPPMRGWA